MLDTRRLSSDTPASLVTRHFVVGGHKRLMHKAAQFNFGTSEHVGQENVNEVILKLLHIPDKISDSHNKYSVTLFLRAMDFVQIS